MTGTVQHVSAEPLRRIATGLPTPEHNVPEVAA
jgi:hypothetical protein